MKNFSAKAEGRQGLPGDIINEYLVLAYTDSPIQRKGKYDEGRSEE